MEPGGSEQNPYRPPAEHWSRDRGDGDDELVRSKANHALAFALIGLVCCGIIFGPLAIQRANEAEALMIARDAGFDVHGRIKTARIVGIADIVLFVAGLAFLLASLSLR